MVGVVVVVAVAVAVAVGVAVGVAVAVVVAVGGREMTIDHDAIAARVRQDRKAGTPGKWIADPHDAEADQDRYDTVFADAGIHGASPLAFIPHFWSAHWVDACRIAGLPRLEAAYLDLYDEVKRLRAALTIYAQSGNWRLGGCCDPNSPNFTG